jgi:hypothetical protein
MKSLIDLLYVYVLLPYELYVQGGYGRSRGKAMREAEDKGELPS